MARWDFGQGKQVDLIFQTQAGPSRADLTKRTIVGKTSCRRASYRLGHLGLGRKHPETHYGCPQQLPRSERSWYTELRTEQGDLFIDKELLA